MTGKPLWIGMVLLLRSMASYAEDSPAAILDHARTVYQALNSYSDTGTVLYEYSPTAHDEHNFNTAFNRNPRHFRLDFHKGSGDRIVITADPDAFHGNASQRCSRRCSRSRRRTPGARCPSSPPSPWARYRQRQCH